MKNWFFRFADICAFLGFAAFFGAGLQFVGISDFSHKFDLTTHRWGFFFVPLIISELIKLKSQKFTSRQEHQSSFLNIVQIIVAKISATHSWALIAKIFIGGLTAAWIAYNVNRYFAWQTGWDLAIYAQACSNQMYSHLREHRHLMADHFEPILFLLAPMCERTNPALFLLVLQGSVLGFASSGVYCLFARVCEKKSLGFLAAVLFAALIDVQKILQYDFHPYSLTLATIPWMLWSLYSRKLWMFYTLVILHWSLKENTSFFTMGLGVVLVLWSKKLNINRVHGVALLCVSLFVFFAVMKLSFPYFRDGSDSQYFAKYYGYLGSTMSEFIVSFFTKPWLWLVQLGDWDRIKYLMFFLIGFWSWVYQPWVLLPVLPGLLLNSLSSIGFLHSRSYHYDSELIAWMFCVHGLFLLNQGELLHRTTKIKVFENYQKTLLFAALIYAVFMSGESVVALMNQTRPSRTDLEYHKAVLGVKSELKDCKLVVPDTMISAFAGLRYVSMYDQYQDADAILLAHPRANKSWLVDEEFVQTKLLPFAHKMTSMKQPLLWDQDFRVFSNCQSSAK